MGGRRPQRQRLSLPRCQAFALKRLHCSAAYFFLCFAPGRLGLRLLCLRKQRVGVADFELAGGFHVQRDHLAVLDQHGIAVAAQA